MAILAFVDYPDRLLLPLLVAGCSKETPTIVARVNGDPILAKELEGEPQATRRAKLDDLIREKLLLAEARKAGIVLSPEESSALEKEARGPYPAETLARHLAASGQTEGQWLQGLKERKIIERLLQKRFGESSKPTEADIAAYYKGHRNEFSRGEEVRARHILSDDRKTAEEIHNQLQNGANFALIAEKKSLAPERVRGGDLGYFGRGTYPLVFEETCFALKPGQTSGVIASEYGYHIFKLIDRREARMIPQDEVRETIRLTLESQRYKSLTERWFEDLKKEVRVEIFEDVLEALGSHPAPP